MEGRSFTKEELSEYSGKDQRKAYIAYKGNVYDVTNSFHWKNGDHWVLHKAGKDLTREMKDAPHFDDLLFTFNIVGTLVE